MVQKNLAVQNTAQAVTKWIGSPSSVIIHTLLFVVAIAIMALRIFPFEAVMLVLTTAVSLEAIYLSIFIQMSINTQSVQLTEIAEDIDEIQEEVVEDEAE